MPDVPFGRYIPERMPTRIQPRTKAEAVVTVLGRDGRLASYRYATRNADGSCTVQWMGERHRVTELQKDGTYLFQPPLPPAVDLEEPLPTSSFLEE